jgi:Flp pilus assembly protein TadD
MFLAIVLGAVLVYAPALRAEFLWDDDYLVGENPLFRSPLFILEVFRHYLFLDSTSIYYRPVQNLSYMLDYWIWNTNPFGYHLTNVCSHGLSAGLLYLLLRRLLPPLLGEKEGDPKAPLIAALVSLVWMVHPVHSAAVAYVSGRADSLTSLLMLAAWLIYLRAGSAGGRIPRFFAYAGAGLLGLLGLCARETGAIWVALFLIHLFAFDSGRAWRVKVGTSAAVFLIVGCYLFLRHLPPARQTMPVGLINSFPDRITWMFRALGDYCGLIFYPARLHVDRIPAVRMAYLGILTSLAVCYFCWRRFPGQRLRILGAIWFTVGFLPVSNLFPLNAPVAEHWLYLPSIGLLLFLAGCIVALPVRAQTISCGVVLLAIVAFGIRTNLRSRDWMDAETFYRSTIASGGGTPRIHQNLALVYARRGQDDLAEQILREAVQRFPDYEKARINLGTHLVKEGKTAEAERYLKGGQATGESVSKSPATADGALGLAQMLSGEKRNDEALAIVDDAITHHPENWEFAQFRATLLQNTGRLPEAIATVRSYAGAHWWHYPSHMFLGRLLALDENLEAAATALQQAGSLDVHAVEPFSLIARLRARQNRLEDACDAQRRAIDRDPSRPSQYLYLATILTQLNRKEEAERALKKARELRNQVELNEPEPHAP